MAMPGPSPWGGGEGDVAGSLEGGGVPYKIGVYGEVVNWVTGGAFQLKSWKDVPMRASAPWPIVSLAFPGGWE
jgi:hypothetical protein